MGEVAKTMLIQSLIHQCFKDSRPKVANGTMKRDSTNSKDGTV